MNWLHKLALWLILLGSGLFAAGCNKPDVEFPDKPAPPPQQDPGSTSAPQPGQG